MKSHSNWLFNFIFLISYYNYRISDFESSTNFKTFGNQDNIIQMLPILVTTTNEKQQDAAVAWDPLAGNPVATLNGEVALRNTITAFADGVVCSAARKPYLQLWSFRNSAANFKRLLTKSVVGAFVFTPDGEYIFAAFDKEIFAYQTSSGCLIGVLDGSHFAKIGELKLTHWDSFGPAFLLSADISGFVACWCLGDLINQLDFSTSFSSKESTSTVDTETSVHCSQSKHSPLWYIIQASHSQPICGFLNELALIGGTQGLKAYDLYHGHIQGSVLTDVSGGIHSFCVSNCDEIIFCGANSGLLYTVRINSCKKIYWADKEVHRCFVDSNLQDTQKTITALALSYSLENSILVVGARGGLIEILRPDSLLTCLQRFSILNPSLSTELSFGTQLTGLCLIPRPNWLSANTGSLGLGHINFSSASTSECNSEKSLENVSSIARTCLIEPLKHHYGWRLDDTVRVRLPGLTQRSDIAYNQINIYMDDFYVDSNKNSTNQDDHSQSEYDLLRKQIDQVTTSNRELLRKLVEYELRS